MILPTTIKASPEANKGNALKDLCFLYPKHKLVKPSSKEAERKNHSKVSETNKDKLKIGKTTNTKGITVQCNAQIIEAIYPNLSSLFIIIIYLLLHELYQIKLLTNL